MKTSSHRPDGLLGFGHAWTTAQGVTMTGPDMTRQICRLGGVYLLERARFVALTIDRNFVTALIFLAITRANVGGITASPKAASRHLALGDIPPDSSRTPVTIYALARDLDIPYETVRRHVGKLKDADACIAVADGVIIPGRVFQAAGARGGALDTERATRRLVAEAAQSGVVARHRCAPVAADVTLQVARLSTDYFVQGVSLISRRLHLDVLSTLVMVTVALMNTETITRDLNLADRYGGLEDIPPDELRAPVKAYAISRFLMMPYETARRTALRLVELGLATRDEAGGLTMPSEVFARPEILAMFVEFAELTMAFLESLAEYGVMADPPAFSAAGSLGKSARSCASRP
jgi:DNA-binding transcriptional ArsR family regulator